jgi:hypothetical protein
MCLDPNSAVVVYFDRNAKISLLEFKVRGAVIDSYGFF